MSLTPGLRLKLLIPVYCVSLIILLISSALLYYFQRQQLIENAYSTSATLNTSIQVSLRHAMETADWNMMNEVIRSVASEGAVDSLRILDTQGVVGASSVPEEVGQQFSLESPTCQSCHATGSLPQDAGEDVAGAHLNDSTIITGLETGSQILLSVSLIENRPECHECHGEQPAVLGLLMTETPLNALKGQIARSGIQTALIALGAFVLLTGVLVPILNRQVIRPVENLSQGVKQLRLGNLDVEVQESHPDELGLLAESLNELRSQLKDSYANLRKQSRDLAILNEMGRAVVQLKDLEDILNYTLEMVTSQFHMGAGLIYLWDAAEGCCTLKAHRGASPEQIEKIIERRRAGYDIPLEVAASGKEVFVPDMSSDARFEGIWEPRAGRSYANLPLLSRGTVVGVIALVAAPGDRFTESEVAFLKAAGREVGIAIDNALLLAETQQREQQAITLQELGTKISASLALAEVLDAVAAAARDLFGADTGLVGLFDETTREVVIRAASGANAEHLKGKRIQTTEDQPGYLLAVGRPVLIEAYVPGQPMLHDLESLEGSQVSSFLAVPLQLGEHFLGVVEVISQQPRRFLKEDAQLLMRLAQQVVISVENAILYRQLRYMATLEERDRIAREMHDHLAQALGYINIKASMTGDLVESGKVEMAQESLVELKRVAQLLYTDVREAIFNLRTTLASSVDLLPSLEKYLNDYRRRSEIEIQLVIENEETGEFSQETASQLLHIVQEALTNARKHAAPSHVWVRYSQAGRQVRIIIEDDGQGFQIDDNTGSDPQHVGLTVMRERAESIGGSLVLDSEPGRGTRVTVTAPTLLETDGDYYY